MLPMGFYLSYYYVIQFVALFFFKLENPSWTKNQVHIRTIFFFFFDTLTVIQDQQSVLPSKSLSVHFPNTLSLKSRTVYFYKGCEVSWLDEKDVYVVYLLILCQIHNVMILKYLLYNFQSFQTIFGWNIENFENYTLFCSFCVKKLKFFVRKSEILVQAWVREYLSN